MSRQRPEAAIQRAVFQHLRMRSAPGVFAFHPANGGYRKPIEAAIMKGLGVVAASQRDPRLRNPKTGRGPSKKNQQGCAPRASSEQAILGRNLRDAQPPSKALG